MKQFLAELSRRRVYATVSIYVIASWLLLQIADVLFPGWGIAEESIRFVTYAALACFPIACIIGWKYDITREGIRKTSSLAEEAQGATGVALQGADRLLITVLTLAAVGIVGGFAWKAGQQKEWVGEALLPNSVAVMPLSSLSEDEGNEYFADGLSVELINMLGQIRGFRVTPSTSTEYFRGRSVDLEEVATKLRVAHVLTGSVLRAAGQVRVSLSLTNTSNGYNTWSDSWDRDFEDIFTIQSEIARAVAEALKVQILGHEQQRLDAAPTTNSEAYDLLLLAQQQQDPNRKRDYIKRALDLDPDYLDAHYAQSLHEFYSFGKQGSGWIGALETLDLAQRTLDLADRLAPDAAETSYMYNWIKGLMIRRQLWVGDKVSAEVEQGMERAFLRAIELNPSESVPYLSLSIYYRWAGRLVDAEKMLLQALELDRLYMAAMLQLSRIYSRQGRDQDAMELAVRVTDLFKLQFGLVGDMYADLGRYDQAIEWLMKEPDKSAQSFGGHRFSILLESAYRGLRDETGIQAWHQFNEKGSDEDGGGLHHDLGDARNLALQGQYQQAFELANAAVEEHQTTQWWLLNEPAYYAVLSGNHADAVRLYEKGYPSLRDPLRPNVTQGSIEDVLYFAYALQQLGDTARAGVIFGRILDETEGKRLVGFQHVAPVEACVYASLGENQRAVEALRRAVDAGWRGLYDSFLGTPPLMFEALQDEPGYQALVAEIDADLATQLQNVREMGY